jgi:hypothetical protein
MHIYRRGKTYWVRAQRQNREYRRSLKTTDRTIADRRARAWLSELDAIAWGEKPRRSYAEAEEKFIREHLTAVKPRAAQRYGVSLKHLSEHFGDRTLEQITSATLSDFETKRRQQGVSPSTIRRDLACLSSLLTSCVDWEWIDSNIVPAYLRRRSKRGLKEGAPRTRYLPEAEEVLLLKAATAEVRKAIILAIDTGCVGRNCFRCAGLKLIWTVASSGPRPKPRAAVPVQSLCQSDHAASSRHFRDSMITS